MKKFIKKWWFSILLWIAALFITVYSIIYLFVDDYAFVQFTHLTGGALLPSLFLFCLGAAQVENEKQTIKVYRRSGEIDKTIEKFKFYGYEVVDVKLLNKKLPFVDKWEIEFVKIEDKKRRDEK